jgi:general secretion pathway protein N
MMKFMISGTAVTILALACPAMAQSPRAENQVRSFVMPPLEELNATRGRPLFSPQRKPDTKVAAPTEAPVVEEAPTSVPFDLTGVVSGEDHTVAILQNRETQETVHLKQGESADIWSVAEIGSRHVVLRSEGRQVRLQLFEPQPDGAEPRPRPPIDYERPRPRRPGAESNLRRNVERERERRRRQRMRQEN